MFTFILDLKTISILLVLITTFVTLVMVFAWLTQKTYRGFGLWVIANIAVASGMILLGIKSDVADLIGTSLSFGGVLIAYEGSRRFLGFENNLHFSLSIFVIELIAHIYLHFIIENIVLQVAVSSMLAGFVTGLCGYLFLKKSTEKKGFSHKLAAFTYFIFAAIMLTRAFLKFSTLSNTGFNNIEGVQSIFFIVYILFEIACTFNYINLNANRLQNELKDTQSELEKLATTDFLTQTSNRRKFLEVSENEIQRAKRFRYDVCLVMFDIDKFKLINDKYGHLGGDEVLVAVAQISKGILRKTDTIGRLGGEEFGILLPYTNLDGAITVAECIRNKIAESELEFSDKIIKFTASFGVSEVKGTDHEIKDVIERVDKMLYKAKDEGRNKVSADENLSNSNELVFA